MQELKPTDEERKEVTKMTAVGIPQASIARLIRGGIDLKTLRKHFREELDTAATKANSNVGGMLYNQAMAGNVTAAIWWSKTRMGWKDTSVKEMGGIGGGPIEYSDMSDAALEARLKALVNEGQS